MSPRDFRAIFLPYCLKKQDDGRYAVLNRRYKPVGFQTLEFLNYQDYPICAKLKGLRSTNAAKISFNGNPGTDEIFLYDDGCVPTHSAKHMRDYLQRLERLAKLEVESIIERMRQTKSPLKFIHLRLKEGGFAKVSNSSNPKINDCLGRIAALNEKTVEVWLRDVETMAMNKHTLEYSEVKPVSLEQVPGAQEMCDRFSALRERGLDPFELEVLMLLDRAVVLTPVEMGYLEGIEKKG